MLRHTIAVMLSGFMLGSGLTVSAGLWMQCQAQAYLARPLPPNHGHCGMPVLGALFVTLFGWPFGGAVGAVGGLIVALIYRLAVAIDGDEFRPRTATRPNSHRADKPD